MRGPCFLLSRLGLGLDTVVGVGCIRGRFLNALIAVGSRTLTKVSLMTRSSGFVGLVVWSIGQQTLDLKTCFLELDST